MRLVIDISKDRYDEIMSMDWKNCRLLFDEEIRAIHDGKALEKEPIFDKPHIKGDYYDGFKNGLRTAEWRNDKIRTEIEQFAKNPDFGDLSLGASCGAMRALEIIDKYKAEESEDEE